MAAEARISADSSLAASLKIVKSDAPQLLVDFCNVIPGLCGFQAGYFK
jgi:hypothetical protein